MNKKIIETRCTPITLERREEEQSGIIKGRAVVYSSWTDIGWFDEIIEPGALDSTDLTDVRLCLNHDTSYVYARSRRNNPRSTMQLFPGEAGLDISASLNLEGSPKARDLWSAIEREDIDKMSFMFTVDSDRWDDLESDHPKRHILKIGRIFEVSAVTFPAYDTTFITTSGKDALDSARAAALENARQARSDAPDGADEEQTRKEIEILKLKTKILGGI